MTTVHECTEWSFHAPGEPIPADRTPITMTLRLGDRTVLVPGFWDGDDVYRVRFAAPVAGTWSWETTSEHPALNALTGTLDVAAGERRGPVGVASVFHFAHADGTPFRPVGATAYNLLHQSDERIDTTVRATREAGMNKFRFMVFPQAGDRVGRTPEVMPFEKRADGSWNPSRPVPAFFQRLDRLVRAFGDAGIQADVLIFNAYDQGFFGLDRMSEEEDAVYLRYLVARLSAFENVWWSLCNEFDVITDRPRERWTRMGELLRAIDPHDHLRSIHNWMDLYDNNQPWVTHASIQNGSATIDFGRALLYRDVYEKPIVLDEIKYEGDISDRWGDLSAGELVRRMWITTVSGCYVTHGESFVLPDGGLHMVEGGEFQGQSAARAGFLRRILDELEIAGLDPIDKWDDPAYVAGAPRRQYLQYLPDAPGAWTFRLPQGNVGERLEVGDRFRVDVIDTWNMTVSPSERVFTVTEVQRNDAYARDDAPLELPAGEALALRITRVA
ncbi:DUF4038 domain-containing protein [Microbacterium sp. ZW T5_56]|uniref:apiosidase-like domain-containing protein n=1 Tax=Microbacterium sp. ZW T5_56 TaxID=3378081 RepID=UPI003854FA70